jgi:hypothetical protein
MIDSELHKFVNAMTEENKYRLMDFAEGFSILCISSNLDGNKEFSVAFTNNENVDDVETLKSITVVSSYNLDCGIYKVKDLPYYDKKPFEDKVEEMASSFSELDYMVSLM